jgi:adenine-specific DNA-methyltransferase
MRYIGNKTKLLREIESFIAERAIRGKDLFDVFAGTASVGRYFKRKGYRVISNDNMYFSYVFQKAYIENNEYPVFARLRDFPPYHRALESGALDRASGKRTPNRTPFPPGKLPIHRVITFLNRYVPGKKGLVYRNFSPGKGGMAHFFTQENACRIDGILTLLIEWSREGLIAESEFFLLLASLLAAVDRVANISGIYAAYLKKWQSNAMKPLKLRVPEIIRSRHRHAVFNRDSNELVEEVPCDVLYVDPPYNHRQYAANYHVLEVIAELHKIRDRDAYESRLYGKTRMRPYGDQKSLYSSRRPLRRGEGRGRAPAEWALHDLLRKARCRHIVLSYSEEGILSREALGAILADVSGRRRFDFERDFREVRYKRFRSDARDVPVENGYRRSYKVLKGKKPDEISEWLFYAEKRY